MTRSSDLTCVAAAGVVKAHTDCLQYPGSAGGKYDGFPVLFTAGRQMARFGREGNIILIASMSGSITNRDHEWVSYNTFKSAVLQMACELGEKNIRVNTLSLGYFHMR